ncbi:MAG: mevalonate kinase [Candidatus Aenigmatarchaeota archaeon]
MIIASAPRKIILFGEHAVVYGKIGISAAFDSRIKVSIEENKNNNIKVNDAEGLNSFSSNKEEVLNLLLKFHKIYQEKNFSEIKNMSFTDALKIVIAETFNKYNTWKNVNIYWPKRNAIKGTGTSAALWAATSAAIISFIEKTIDKKIINEIAYLGDVIAHAGTPSGIDNSTVTYGGYLTYTKANGPQPLPINFKLPIVIIDSGEVKMNTAQTVSYVREQYEKKHDFVENILNNLNEISYQAIEAIKDKKIKNIGILMNEYYKELSKLNISTKRLDEIIKIGIKNDVLGIKPTGGWGGGICIALAENEEHANELIKNFEKNNFHAFLTKLGVEGVKIEGE